jgi:hypothetical protein
MKMLLYILAGFSVAFILVVVVKVLWLLWQLRNMH